MARRNVAGGPGPEMRSTSRSMVQGAPRDDAVRITLGEVLPLLADAVASDRTWLSDFADDDITITSDLFDVLQAYRHFRRPSA